MRLILKTVVTIFYLLRFQSLFSMWNLQRMWIALIKSPTASMMKTEDLEGYNFKLGIQGYKLQAKVVEVGKRMQSGIHRWLFELFSTIKMQILSFCQERNCTKLQRKYYKIRNHTPNWQYMNEKSLKNYKIVFQNNKKWTEYWKLLQ